MNESAANKTVLSNGVRILSKTMPHARSVSMGVWVNVGARDESASENGLSHMIEHMIFKGTRQRSASQIAKEFDAIGGHTNAFTSFEATCYHARVMDIHLGKMVDILTDIFLNSIFDPREVEKERPVIFQEIGMVEDNPEEYIHLLTGRAYWGENPLGRSILGTRENLLGFSSDTLKGFFKRFYQPSRIVVTVAGQIDHNRFVDLIGPGFEGIEAGQHLPTRSTPSGHPQIRLHHRSLEQAHICLAAPGISISDPHRFAFSLLNTICGGNMSSRLFQRIREERGLAYSVYSFTSSYEDTGMFGAYAGVHPDNADETVSLIVSELRKLRTRPVEAGELEDAKNFTKGNLLLASESVDNQMVRLAQNEINFGRHIPMEEVVEHIDATVAEEITELAANMLRDDQIALTCLGPITEDTSFRRLLSDRPSHAVNE